jgi:hypothetical protein
MIQGKRQNGFSVVDGEKLKVIESGRLPNHWPAQMCKLFVLNQVLKSLKEKILSMHLGSAHLWEDMGRKGIN